MHSIICATRGGDSSRAVEFAAINLAKTTGKPLVFLYVIDTTSYGDLEEMMLSALRDELFWMGSTLLRIAERRAKAANLKAEIVIREGPVREEISNFAASTQADLLLLGAPRHNSMTIFAENEIEKFAHSIHQSTGIPVEIVRPDDLPPRFKQQ